MGNTYLIKNLRSSIAHNKLSHAYIIDGREGLGKKLLANTLAKTLQCEENKTTACCKCISCQTFDSGNQPDIIYIKPTKTKAIGIDDVREQIGTIVEIKPYKYKYKIFIIEDADTMTVQAQNAILKTIEEPPSYAVFLMLSTNSNSFLPTILSRCAMLKLKPLSEYIIKNYIIDNLGIAQEKAGVYSTFAQGSIGRAKEIATSDIFIQKREQIIKWLIELKHKDMIQVFETAKEVEIYKDDINSCLWICFMWYRDLLVAKIFEDKKYIIQKDKVEVIKNEVAQFDCDYIFKAIEIIEDTIYNLRKNANFQLAIEIMFLKLNECF